MRRLSFGILCLLFGLTPGCYDVDETDLEQIVEEESMEENDAEQAPNPSPPAPAADDDEARLSTCPEVAYELWNAEGVRMVVMIEVLCEPIQNMNLGCPEPVF